ETGRVLGDGDEGQRHSAASKSLGRPQPHGPTGFQLQSDERNTTAALRGSFLHANFHRSGPREMSSGTSAIGSRGPAFHLTDPPTSGGDATNRSTAHARSATDTLGPRPAPLPRSSPRRLTDPASENTFTLRTTV